METNIELIKKAHEIHSKKLQPYLQQMVKYMSGNPSVFELNNKIEAINKEWVSYCGDYVLKNKDKHPNKLAFIDSIKMYFRANNSCTSSDFSFIFGETMDLGE